MTAGKLERRRSVECGCGWHGVRLPRVNNRPCPDCGGPVYVVGRRPGRPRTAKASIKVTLPAAWKAALEPGASRKIVLLVQQHLLGENDSP